MSNRFADLDRPGLSEASLRASLTRGKAALGRFDLVQETGSTNADLVDSAVGGAGQFPDLSALTAEHQHAGRGRLGRTWMAPARSALTVSVLLRPLDPAGRALPPGAYSWLSLLAALALADTVAEHALVPAGIKWPNDVVVGGRKLAGILAQLIPASAEAGPAVVVGAGINVSVKAEELATPAATSLLLEDAATLDRSVLLKAYLRTLADLYLGFCAVAGDATAALSGGLPLQRRVSDRMATLGRQVRAQLPGGGADIVGTAVSLEGSGSLLIRSSSGSEHSVAAGDIVHLRAAEGS